MLLTWIVAILIDAMQETALYKIFWGLMSQKQMTKHFSMAKGTCSMAVVGRFVEFILRRSDNWYTRSVSFISEFTIYNLPLSCHMEVRNKWCSVSYAAAMSHASAL